MSTISVRGQKLRTQTRHRFVAVEVRPQPVRGVRDTYPPFAAVKKRSDSDYIAKAFARRHLCGPGAVCVVVDLRTGNEV